MPGTALGQTDALVREIGEHASGIDGVLKTYSVTGVGNRLDANPSESGENTGRINIVMQPDRKSTRLNSSHVKISYAVFCLKKKKKYRNAKRVVLPKKALC